MLSEHEERALAQIEQSLGTSDPRLASAMSRTRRSLVRQTVAIACGLAGAALLVGGSILAGAVLLPGVGMSLCGFCLMLWAAWDLTFGRPSRVRLRRSPEKSSPTTG